MSSTLPDGPVAPGMARHWAGVVPGGRFLPLVRAALALGDPPQLWRDYLDQLGAAIPDDGEVRLFPFVARALGDALATAPQREWLVAARRAALVRNTGLVRAATRLSRRLDEAAIPFLFSKGLALSARVYRSAELRRSSDLDIHVSETHAAGLFALAAAANWSIKGIDRASRPAMFAATGATTFVTAEGDEIDIHWRPRRSFAWLPGWTADFAASRRTIHWLGQAWPVPGDTWLLIETIEHGMEYNSMSSIRWVVDAYSLLRCDDVQIDWDVVVAAAGAARVRPAMQFGLRILAALGAPVPAEVLAHPGWHASALERANFRWRMRRRGPATTVVDESLHYLLRGPGTPLARVVALPRYIRVDSFEYPRWRDLWFRLRHGTRRGKTGQGSPGPVTRTGR